MPKKKYVPLEESLVGMTIKSVDALTYSRHAYLYFEDGSSLAIDVTLYGGCGCAEADLEISHNPAPKE